MQSVQFTRCITYMPYRLQCESKKSPPPRSFLTFPLFPTMTKLCHIQRNHPVHTIMLKMSTIGRNARWPFLIFCPNSWEFLVQILHTYYTFTSTLDYKFLFNYLQPWRSYAILSVTTQRAFRPMVDILSIWWWPRLKWHNFVKVADNWIKICCLA